MKALPRNSVEAGISVKFMIWVFFFVSIMGAASSQEKRLLYQVTKNGTVIGSMQLAELTFPDKVVVKLDSKIKTHNLFSVSVLTREETVFQNGMITYSSIYRNLNGDEKENKQLKVSASNYKIEKGNKTEMLNFYPIKHNMLSLYFSEPVHIPKLYSDNLQEFLDIKKLAPDQYQVTFPNGNYNLFFYKDGICQKINVHHSLYNVEIILKDIIYL